MEVLFFLLPFLALGIGVVFIAFAGGAGRAREAYLTRGGKAFTIAIVLLYLVVGIAIPAAVIADRDESIGGVGSLRTADISDREENGKELFTQNCKSCHNLDAVQARGVTGPEPRRARRRGPRAGHERDQEWRHGGRPDARQPALGRGRGGRGRLRRTGRGPVAGPGSGTVPRR